MSIPMRANRQQARTYAKRSGPATGRDFQASLGAFPPVESLGGKSMSHRPGCPRTPVTGLASWCGSVSTHRHAPGRPSTSARLTWPMIAEVTSRPAGGHSPAGADRSMSLLAWIHSTPRQEGFQGRSSTAWSPATIRHAQGFMTLITRAGSAVTARSSLRRPARGRSRWRAFPGARRNTCRWCMARPAGRRRRGRRP
jgi:hypothetical protein